MSGKYSWNIWTRLEDWLSCRVPYSVRYLNMVSLVKDLVSDYEEELLKKDKHIHALQAENEALRAAVKKAERS